MGAGRKHAKGARVTYYAAKQSAFGTPVAVDRRLLFTFAYDVKPNRTFETFSEPSPLRGVRGSVETNRSPEGSFNYLMRSEGLGLMFQGAFGSDEDVLTIANCDAGVRCQLTNDYTGGTSLVCDYIPAGFPASGKLAVIYRTDGDVEKQLKAETNVTYSSYAGNVFTISAPLSTLTEIKAEDYIVLYEPTSGAWNGVYSHIYMGGAQLETVITFGVLEDIQSFYFYDAKIDTLTETYPRDGVATGALGVVAGEMFNRGLLGADTTAGSTTIPLLDRDNMVRDFNIFYGATGGTVWIDTESAITFTGVNTTTNELTGVPASGSDSIQTSHYVPPNGPERPVVAPSSMPIIATTVTDDPLTNFNLGYTFRVSDATGFAATAIEVFEADWTLNNQLFKGKRPHGQTARAALPPGQRLVTGKYHLEFDSPAEDNRALEQTLIHLEYSGVDSANLIGSTTIPKRVDTVFGRAKILGDTPVSSDANLIEYDQNWQAFLTDHTPEVIRFVVNAQSSATAGA